MSLFFILFIFYFSEFSKPKTCSFSVSRLLMKLGTYSLSGCNFSIMRRIKPAIRPHLMQPKIAPSR